MYERHVIKSLADIVSEDSLLQGLGRKEIAWSVNKRHHIGPSLLDIFDLRILFRFIETTIKSGERHVARDVGELAWLYLC